MFLLISFFTLELLKAEQYCLTDHIWLSALMGGGKKPCLGCILESVR